jgi:RNA polymerase sigma factor (sigma-70 family)
MTANSSPSPLLSQISTRWPLITNPVQFVLRYAPAIRSYLGALIKNQHDAEDVTQAFLLRMVENTFDPGRLQRGRFRDYLKAALRNEAISHFRRKRPVQADDEILARLTDTEAPPSGADEEWLQKWRGCLLERAWEGLHRHERSGGANLSYLVLRLATDYPTESSPELAARVAAKLQKPYRAEAFRQQLSRARRQFAKLIVAEIRQTLERPTSELVLEELTDLGLMDYIRDFLPAADGKPAV